MELNERDFLIFKVIYKFRFCLGRHIKEFSDFPSSRTCDRRLKKLVDAKYLERTKYLYGIPYIYTLSHKGRLLVGINKRAEKIRLDLLRHDITVLDCVLYILKQNNLNFDDITTEKELHVQSGFNFRQHAPDFLINSDNENHAFEVELTLKNKDIVEKNIKANFLKYDRQTWITDNKKVFEILEGFKAEYLNIHVIRLEDFLNDT